MVRIDIGCGSSARTRERERRARANPGAQEGIAYGSSARTPERLLTSSLRVVPRRFIRAHAETTTRCAAARGRRAVHPRAGGSDDGSDLGVETALGSSARARERRVRHVPGPFPARFIRARAGATATWFTLARSLTVHPRARGSDTSNSLAFCAREAVDVSTRAGVPCDTLFVNSRLLVGCLWAT